ncbi:putative aig2-like protein [Phaeomoniella chlamydospora]|uniref:Putative aig2-like protein n=1 Tax=Phaeomoniella chlamydospora TaxID=158046 RepID=A0A0G2GWJ3_PHACM|nr:putative aig2-like protein [Phaeomoniella chlamydospora]
MDLLAELETMAVNVVEEPQCSDSQGPIVHQEKILQWQQLFGFTATDAMEHILRHREDIFRIRVSDEHWQMVMVDKKGYDKEAYEFELGHAHGHKQALEEPALIMPRQETPGNVTYLVKLEGLLESPAMVQQAAGLSNAPPVAKGMADSGDDAQFCIINGSDKALVMDWLAARGQQHFRPTFIRLSASMKDLSLISLAPFLGVESSLPQYRVDDGKDVGVLQDEYPVWYFCYGNLAKSDILMKLLSLESPPRYHSARVTGGIVKRWAGKYNAMIDGPEASVVDGWAYRVMSKHDEDILRFHESGNYEVVRCNISMHDRAVKGLTFRYSGPPLQLD